MNPLYLGVAENTRVINSGPHRNLRDTPVPTSLWKWRGVLPPGVHRRAV